MNILLAFLFITICVLLILIVLVQKGRGGGLGAAFGGGGAGSAFGTKTGDVATWITIALAAAFLLVGIVTSKITKPPTVPADVPVATITTTGENQLSIVVSDKQADPGDNVQRLDEAGHEWEVAIPGPAEIALKVGTPAKANIYYLKGKDKVEETLSEESPIYAKTKISVEPGDTLRAFAKGAGYDPSPTLRISFVLPRIAPPEITPSPKAIYQPISVKLIPKAEQAVIHYTIDGTDPDETTPVYESPFEVSPGTVVKARAYPTDPASASPSSLLVAEFTRAEADVPSSTQPAALPESPAPAPDAPVEE